MASIQDTTQPDSISADEGILEIYDPEKDAVQRIEMQVLGPGEVKTIGSHPQCAICLDDEAGPGEHAALIMTPRGPLIESRGAALWCGGRKVKQHLLFDGDHLYLGRFVLYYHNFFRQRHAPDVSGVEGGNRENDS